MKKLSLEEFKASLSSKEPAEILSPQGKALWYAGKGDWKKAHLIVQEMNDPLSSQIHAFLHRQEGDISNAGYWYSKAGNVLPVMSLNEEWENLVRNVL